MKSVVIHQPDFLPHLAFFHRLLDADLYIVLDHVQFVTGTSRAWTYRDRIKTRDGVKWLTISVKKAKLQTPINAIELAETDWRTKNLNLLYNSYKHSRYFSEIYPRIEKLYKIPGTKLLELNMASIKLLMEMLNISLPIVYSSDLNPKGHKNELLVDLLNKVDATHYISGLGARTYFKSKPFKTAGVTVKWQKFTHPVYPQLHGDFVSFLSSIDALFNCGPHETKNLLRSI